MKTIKHVSNFGRFAYEATAEVGDEVNEATTKLCLEGLASVCYRAGGSEAEKALTKAGHMVKDQKRSEVKYSAEAMEVLQTSFDAKMAEVVAKNGLPKVEVLFTGEHEFGEGAGSSRKMATTLVAQMRAEKDEKKRAMRFFMLGLEESVEDSVVIEAAHEFLSSLRAK